MSQKILAVFAHPDDEAFGPGGTLAVWAKQGHTIHLLCATRGEVGHGHHQPDLARIRAQELRRSAKILGIKKVEFLNYQDGLISNRDLPGLENNIAAKVKAFQPDRLLTFNLNGVSGHLDHMAVASAATQVFRKHPSIRKIYYYTLLKAFSDHMADYFIYFPEGIQPHQADEAIDTSEVIGTRHRAMRQHLSQIEDVNAILKLEQDLPAREYFLVQSRSKTSP